MESEWYRRPRTRFRLLPSRRDEPAAHLFETDDLHDRVIPRLLRLFYRREALLTSYAARSNENARKSGADLFGVQNNRKRYDGHIATLLVPEVMSAFVQRETDLSAKITADPKLAPTLAAYDQIQTAQAVIATDARAFDYLEAVRNSKSAFRAPQAFHNTLFTIARALLRTGDERPKPNGERFPEYRDSGRDSFELQLFSEEPLYADYEELILTDSLTDFAE